MKLLLDQGTPRRAAELFRMAGYTAIHTTEIGWTHARDHELLARAQQQQEVIIAYDSDFHAILAATKATKPSVVRVRIEGLKGPDLADLVIPVLQQHEQALLTGAVITITRAGPRVHPLPLK